jgi:lipopolysaccharide export system permease protein
VVFYASIYYFYKLRSNSETLILKAVGFSPINLLMPSIIANIAIGFLILGGVSPVAAELYSKFKKSETKLLAKGDLGQLINLSENGLWLKQGLEEGNNIIYIRRFIPDEKKIFGITIYDLSKENKFLQRFDGSVAEIKDGYWLIDDCVKTKFNLVEKIGKCHFYNEINLFRLEERFLSPKMVNIWQIRDLTKKMRQAGLSAIKYEIHFFHSLALPVLFISASLLAYIFVISLNQNPRNSRFFSQAIIIGPLLYFLQLVSTNFGLAGKIPAMVSAWIFPISLLSLSLALMVHFEY